MLNFYAKNAAFAVPVLLFLAAFSLAQDTVQTEDIKTILEKASAQTSAYKEEFKNLIAKEVKTFSRYDKSGKVKKQNVVESNFVVYQSARDNSFVTEFRNVTKVDDKPISNSDARSGEFFAELKKTDSSAKELAKIEKESQRYDKSLEISGLTLLQSPVLSEELRPYFDFEITGKETIEGNEVYVVSYRQNKPSPFISVNGSAGDPDKLKFDFRLDLPNFVKKSDVIMRGKLWIDAGNFRLWREERELVSQTASPVMLLKTDFVYRPSDFDILVPKQISLLEYKAKKDQPETINTKVTFDYSKFNKTDVDVKIIDEN